MGITKGAIYVKEADLSRLMEDDHFVRLPSVCSHKEAIGYYIGKYCLSEVVIEKR